MQPKLITDQLIDGVLQRVTDVARFCSIATLKYFALTFTTSVKMSDDRMPDCARTSTGGSVVVKGNEVKLQIVAALITFTLREQIVAKGRGNAN